MAVPCDKRRMFLSVSSVFDVRSAAYSVAGMIRDADATAMREDMVLATVSLKERSCSRIPPARKQQPRT